MVSSMTSEILQCFNAGLDSMGSVSRRIVYTHLLQVRKLREEDIPEKPMEFLEVLRELFGQGAGILERTIVRELKRAFNITLGDDLSEVLGLIKQSRGAYSRASTHLSASGSQRQSSDLKG